MKRLFAAAAIAGSMMVCAPALAAPPPASAPLAAGGVILGVNELALASGSLPGSPEEAALDLALDYIQNGGDSGKTAAQLEQELESSSSAGGSVTDATCVEDAVDPLGVGTYGCMLRFDDGAGLPYRITVSDDGTWAASASE